MFLLYIFQSLIFTWLFVEIFDIVVRGVISFMNKGG